MIAVYKGNKYKFVLNKRRKGIITRCVQKTDGSFFKENDIYYKPLDEKDLSDIYAVEFYVFFDTGFKDVSTWWKITEADLLDNKVKLRFAEGILPGWDIFKLSAKLHSCLKSSIKCLTFSLICIFRCQLSVTCP